MFPRTLFGVITLGTIMLSAAPAFAQGVDKDMRCMILSEAFSKMEKDPAKKQLAVATELYYFGRVDVQISGVALRSQFTAQKSVLQQQNAGLEMSACAKEFISHQHNLQTSIQGPVEKKAPAKK